MPEEDLVDVPEAVAVGFSRMEIGVAGPAAELALCRAITRLRSGQRQRFVLQLGVGDRERAVRRRLKQVLGVLGVPGDVVLRADTVGLPGAGVIEVDVGVS